MCVCVFVCEHFVYGQRVFTKHVSREHSALDLVITIDRMNDDQYSSDPARIFELQPKQHTHSH